jgi:hypothetical protein
MGEGECVGGVIHYMKTALEDEMNMRQSVLPAAFQGSMNARELFLVPVPT